MINQNWWFSTLLIRQFKYCPPLNESIKCDVLIVGGFSGMSAAAEFLQKGFKVVLIDRNMVGGSSSGRSAGFLTPDSELELHQLVRRFGADAAGEIWEMPCRGIDRIVQAIMKNNMFALPSGLANIVGSRRFFSLANSWAKFYQVDTHRKPVAMKDEL